MKTVVVVFVFFFCSLYQSNSQEFLSVSGRNLTLNGEKVFLSGMNQAWHSYASDFGLNFYSKSRPFLIKTLDDIKKSGGNSISTFRFCIRRITTTNFLKIGIPKHLP